MASNKIFRAGPIALTSTLTTNILNPATTTGGVNGGATATYIVMRHIRIVNKTAGAVTCSFWIGATGANAAGTEFAFQGTSVAANSYVDWYGVCPLTSTDFLVGGASANTSLSFEVEGEIGIS